MNLQDKAHQIFKLAEHAAKLIDTVTPQMMQSRELVASSALKKPYQKNVELQPGAQEQIIYLMADMVIGLRKGLQTEYAQAVLENPAVSDFMKESEWEGIAIHGYMLPHLTPLAQSYVFKSLCDLAEERSDDFAPDMVGFIKDMDINVRAEAVDYVLGKEAMQALQKTNVNVFTQDVSKLYALLAADDERKLGKAGGQAVVCVESNDKRRIVLVSSMGGLSADEVDAQWKAEIRDIRSHIHVSPQLKEQYIPFTKKMMKDRADLNIFFREAADQRRENDPELAGLLLNAARVIGKGRHAENALT